MARIVLRGMNGEFQGRTWESSELLRIGRLDALEVVLSDSSVSRYHAEIQWTERGWMVRDLGSTNGTRLNGVRLGDGQWPMNGVRLGLLVRDFLQFGEVAVVVESITNPTAWEGLASAKTPEEKVAAIRRMSISARKLRLLACACFRSKWQDFPPEATRLAERHLDGLGEEEESEAGLVCQPFVARAIIEQVAASRLLGVAERYADGLASPEELEAARHGSEFGGHHGMAHTACSLPPIQVILDGESDDDDRHRQKAIFYSGEDFCDNPIRWRDEYLPILAEVVGPLPCGPVPVDPSWLAANDGLVGKMAQAIYEDRSFDDMPILADALEEAGCMEQAILHHCRKSGNHWRGCWVLDLLTGRD